jgi:hypothetical protein
VALVRRIEIGTQPGVESPSGIAWRPQPPAFLVLSSGRDGAGRRLWALDLASDGDAAREISRADLPAGIRQASGVTWRSGDDRAVVVDDEALRAVVLDADGRVTASFDLAALGARDPEGVALDPAGTRLWIADGRGQQVLELTPQGELLGALPLDAALFEDAEGIAYDPVSGHLFLVSDRGGLLAELTREGELVAVHGLSALGAIRPRGLTLGPSSDPADAPDATSLYVADAVHDGAGAGRILELALVPRPQHALWLGGQVGDVDGFGFRGDEPGFALGDLDHDGLLEPGERIPPKAVWDHRDPEDPRATDRTWVIDERQPLALQLVVPLEGRQPLWARLTLVVADARAVAGRRTAVRVDGRRIGEIVPSRDGRIQAGAIAASVLELPPAALRDLADGELRVELARDPGSGADDLVLDYARLEVAVPR